MKLLVSAAYYTPHISGLTNSIQNLSELLVQNGYDVTVLTTQHDRSLALSEKIAGVRVKRVQYIVRASKGFIMPSFLFNAYRCVKESDQILINLPQFEGFVVALLGKMMGKKVHSIYVCDVTLQGGMAAKLIEYSLRFVNRLTLSLSETVITLTEDFAASSSMLFHKSQQVRIIPPVIKAPKIDTSIQNALLQKMPRKNILKIGFLGRIASEKGLEYLLETIPILKKKLDRDFVILLAGPEQVVGEKAYKEKIEEYLELYKENIVRMGQLKDSELGAFYSLLDVLVLPSINSTEVFGMVQVEAMLCGTPVVASDLPGVRTVIQRTGMGEIAARGDAKDLAAKLIQVLKYRKSYTKRQKEVQEIFSSKPIIAAYNELLDK